MGRKYQVISADGHIETAPERWVKFVPERWKERAPRLVSAPDGGQGWIVEGRPFLHSGPNIVGRGPMKIAGGNYFNEDGSPTEGTGPPEQRLREQDEDGIDAEVLFPSRFVSTFVEGISEPAAYRAMVSAYNTFLAEDYCSFAPDRLIGTAVIPVSGIDDACAELDHIKELGLTTVSPHQFPNGSGFAAPEDDRFWAKTLELNLRVAPHINMGQASTPVSVGGSLGISEQLVGLLTRRYDPKPVFCLSQLMVSGVFDRFPELSIYFGETQAHWLPAALWFLDDSYDIWNKTFGVTLKHKPSEYVLHHCYFSIIRDPLALKMPSLPIDRIMWGSDFPHSVGTFPESRRFLDEAFAGLGPDVRREVLLETPAKFFGLDLHADITETPA